MKRSEVNAIIGENKKFAAECNFALPKWAFWTPEDWASKGHECDEIRLNGLGWDITDYDLGTFDKLGLSLLTIRNGNFNLDKKTYCEKIMWVRDGQVTPTHFHWKKMEDIIYRAGKGKFCMKLWKADPETEEILDEPVKIKVDGVLRVFQPGEKVELEVGESVCYEPYCYHTFWMEGGTGLIGEVSTVNDDVNDNRFLEELPRFPKVEDDVPAEVLLCTEYPSAK
ncbi:MAG: D-lyxose/D-mannose family sugar isomerase [Bacteroidales bacterium]|nr:D-lyxose/D-mannose family sugar isomerase [Bacteroidales bacterium]